MASFPYHVKKNKFTSNELLVRYEPNQKKNQYGHTKKPRHFSTIFLIRPNIFVRG